MKSIDSLEYGGATSVMPFSIRHQGLKLPLDDPRELHYQSILMALKLRYVGWIPDAVPLWQYELIFDRWCAAWDLPEFNQARRLAYLVDNYRAAISNDLSVYTGLDLGILWRSRCWTKLLDVIDRLPAHSWYASSVAQDEEHAKMMAEAMASRPERNAEDKGPALTTWTPEVAALTNIFDAVRRVEYAIYAAQHGKKAGEPPEPVARPTTALEKALKRTEFSRRKTAHEKLVARVLPNKRPPGGPVH